MTILETPPRPMTDAELAELYKKNPMSDADRERVKGEITRAYHPVPSIQSGPGANAETAPPQSGTISQ